MSIPKGHKTNLKTLIRAAKDDSLAVMECQDRATGKTVNVLCCVGFDNGEYVFTPFATMFDGNPFDMLNPPDPAGGFHA